MFYILETKEHLKRLLEKRKVPTYLEVIPGNDNYHPRLTSTLGVYLRPVNEDTGYVIPIDHPDGINIEKNLVKQILEKFVELYVLDKKEVLYHFILPNLTDLQLLGTINNQDRITLTGTIKTCNSFYSRFPDHPEINKIIPLPKLYEVCESNYEQISHLTELHKDSSFDFYNNTATKLFFLAEQSGLKITYQSFVNLFKPNNPSFNIQDNITYTFYNLYNITSRPTNAFNSVNYAAIPHKEEYRKAIIPKNDKFVELDFDGYHLRLLCNQIGYKLTEERAHTQLARLYFNKEEISDEEYTQAKQMNFHAMYGKIPEKYKNLEIFVKIQNYIDKLWTELNAIGFVTCPISERRFSEDIEDMNPQKLMNYVMQNLETSNNILILKDVLKYLQDKKTNLALYTYDAFLFDYDESDGIEVIEELKRIMSRDGIYPVKEKFGNNMVL